MKRNITLAATVVVMLGGFTEPADACCKFIGKVFGGAVEVFEEVVGGTVKVVMKTSEKAVEGGVHILEGTMEVTGETFELAVGAAEGTVVVTGGVLEGTLDVLEDVAEGTFEVTGEAVELAVGVAGGTVEVTGETVIKGAKETGKVLFMRCYERAKEEPDPEAQRDRIEKCNQKPTGKILGTLGMAVGAYFGPYGSAAGGLAGSIVGSAIDGAPNVFVSVGLPVGSPAPNPAPNPAPDRTPTSYVSIPARPIAIVPNSPSVPSLGTLIHSLSFWLSAVKARDEAPKLHAALSDVAMKHPMGKTVKVYALFHGSTFRGLSPTGSWMDPLDRQVRYEVQGKNLRRAYEQGYTCFSDGSSLNCVPPATPLRDDVCPPPLSAPAPRTPRNPDWVGDGRRVACVTVRP